jgi:4'-phosphopantetheinyl transferase
MVFGCSTKGTLIGRLLTRSLLSQHGVPPAKMIFGVTEAGKPYIVCSLLLWHVQTQMASKKSAGLDCPIAYNISHDNALVAMAFAPGIYGAPAYNLGIDVMKVRIPGRDTFASFVRTVGDQVSCIPSPRLFLFLSIRCVS